MTTHTTSVPHTTDAESTMSAMGAADLRAVASEGFDAFDRVVTTAQRMADRRLYALARARMAMMLRIDDRHAPLGGNLREQMAALTDWPSSPVFGDAERAGLAMAEQFIIDVSAVTDDDRASLAEAMGDDVAPFVQTLYAIDYELRVRAVFEQLFGVDPLHDATTATISNTADGQPTDDTDETDETDETIELWPVLETMLAAVARLDRLDPMTTELVRLRGARVHDCRICKSIRHVRAVEGGGGEALFDQIDRYEQSDMPEQHKVALRLADAIYWSPSQLPAGLVDDVHRHYAPAQIVEIVLDVARNALNKFAVAMGTDGEGVGDGITYYDVGADGQLTYGLTPNVG